MTLILEYVSHTKMAYSYNTQIINTICKILEAINNDSLIASLEIRVYQYLRKRILRSEIETIDSLKLLNLLYYLKNLDDRDITESRLLRILENLHIEEVSG
jgi:hypothetical protein